LAVIRWFGIIPASLSNQNNDIVLRSFPFIGIPYTVQRRIRVFIVRCKT
jgi:hypothetical protein